MSRQDGYTVRLTPFSDDWCGESGGSEEDLISEYLSHRCEEMDDKSVAPSPLVPTISVTPHSPAGKHYPILEDNLQHLHYIHESIQHMRDLSAQQYPNNQEISRLSLSCPSLNDAGSDLDLLSNVTSTPSQTLTLTTPIFPQSAHYRKRGSGEWELYKRTIGTEGEVSRRRSWAALDDLSHAIDSAQPSRQRSGNDLCSISLSSMESDMDDPFCESTTNLLGSEDAKARMRQVRSNPNSSTHSLNEAELQNDFKKVVSRREAETLLLNTRLINSPLQKSVSTPSIITAQLETTHAQLVNETSTSTIPVGCQLGMMESEDDEEMTALLDVDKHLPTSHYFTHVSYDDHSEKRRKRGSLFFRKKKDKVKKVTHQWVTVCCGNSQLCDFCSKSLTNKPSVYCDNCSATVHQHSCKDSIADCKGRGIKVIGKNVAHVTKSGGKRGSNSNQSGSPCSQVNADDDHYHAAHHNDAVSLSDEIPLVQYEFLDEPPVTVHDLGTDPFLGLQDEEPDSWTPTVTKEIIKKMKEKEIKRQEHLYEFILTEKHHCLTLKVMQKVFVEGLKKYLQLGLTVERMFPRLVELTSIHLGFLHELRVRQREAPVIEKVGDILLEQFSGASAVKLKSVYGEFCSNHRNAIDIYKECMQQDGRFAEFVKHCQGNPLLKKKGIPECILFVTQRLTKYPLLIEPLIKTSKDNKEEQERLIRALTLIKDILVEVDAQVAEKEKEDRKLEIYNRIEAKSFTIYRGHKFKKSDIFLENRKLKFEGVAMLMQGRGKMQIVLVIVFSDVLCFLLENNHKYSFFTPENKQAGVVSLQKLLVREKAGQESRGIYLISSNPTEPEMFELKVHKPKDKNVWIKAIREAVQNCPEDDEENKQVLSAEEKQKQFDTKQKNIEEIVDLSVGELKELLRQKDLEQAQLLEEKMALQLKLLAAAGIDNIPERPDYMSLVTQPLDNSKVRKDVFAAVKKVNQLAKSLYTSATNLSRSASSVGEHQSEAYISPTLPKRAETFGGFDNNQPPSSRTAVQKKLQNTNSPTGSSNVGHKIPDSNELVTGEGIDVHPFLITDHDHHLAATQLSHQVYTLSCIISHQMTTIDSLEAELASLKAYAGDSGRPIYRHNQQLEELRNLQDKLQSEREIWQRERDAEFKELQQKKEELSRLQVQIRKAEMDIAQQRDQLYRKLETLSNQGIMMSPTLVVAPALDDSQNSTISSGSHTPPTDPPRRKAEVSKWKQIQQVNKAQTLPLNLISTTNQQKVASSNVQVRQQLPLKLAVKPGSASVSNSCNTNSSTPIPQQMLPLKLCEGSGEPKKSVGYQRLTSGGQSPPQAPTHSRTGSSPAMMQNVLPPETRSCVKAGRTNTYPKLPEKFRVRTADVEPERVPTQNTEEEVIFF
ncbi:rho guanine nucleotide exchange factor 18 cysts isoform X5 [Rhodnius prolixus]|uniref:rho guanine nucleotide exchange factor 18 cysts isoform X5 n=1 Tax=Rhodnius prolixus TaxID=13249 RepID=UPI003D18ED26